MSTPDGGLRARVNGRAARDATADPGDTSARPMWRAVAEVLAVALALGSVAVVLLSDDARWLRMAVVAALWSALLGATALIRRGQDSSGRHDLAALRRRYTRELQREVTARKEYEAGLKHEVQQEIAQELADARDDELESLRDEVDRLRDERAASAAQHEPRLRVVDGPALDPVRPVPAQPTSSSPPQGVPEPARPMLPPAVAEPARSASPVTSERARTAGAPAASERAGTAAAGAASEWPRAAAAGAASERPRAAGPAAVAEPVRPGPYAVPAPAAAHVAPAPPTTPTRTSSVPHGVGRSTPPGPFSVGARLDREDAGGEPSTRAASLFGGSFVDQYVRGTGYQAHEGGSPSRESGLDRDARSDRDAPSDRDARSELDGRSGRDGPESDRARPTARSVADLLAAHAPHADRGATDDDRARRYGTGLRSG